MFWVLLSVTGSENCLVDYKFVMLKFSEMFLIWNASHSLGGKERWLFQEHFECQEKQQNKTTL